MFLNLLIFAITLFCLIRTLSYGIWCIKSKNTAGGIFVMLLALVATFSVVFII